MNPFNRRQFIQRTSQSSAAILAARAMSGELQHTDQVPFRTIYSNDTTHILSCEMPWRDRKEELTDEHLKKSIVEASGVDAHFLQPGLGWIPWWPSKIYSPHDHYVEFLQKEHGCRKLNKIARYLLDGGDMLRTLVSTCQQIGFAPFLSFRLNDGHHVRELKEARKNNRPSEGMSRYYWQNYERFRIGPDESDWDQGVFDWSIPEVSDHKFRLIEEACENYDLAGIELDFHRRTGDDILRLRSDEFIADREIAVSFNGYPIAPLAYVEKPLEHPYNDTWLGSTDEHFCYAVPASAIATGRNEIAVTVSRGIRVRIIYVDLLLP